MIIYVILVEAANPCKCCTDDIEIIEKGIGFRTSRLPIPASVARAMLKSLKRYRFWNVEAANPCDPRSRVVPHGGVPPGGLHSVHGWRMASAYVSSIDSLLVCVRRRRGVWAGGLCPLSCQANRVCGPPTDAQRDVNAT